MRNQKKGALKMRNCKKQVIRIVNWKHWVIKMINRWKEVWIIINNKILLKR
jgi:hypothetical protein